MVRRTKAINRKLLNQISEGWGESTCASTYNKRMATGTFRTSTGLLDFCLLGVDRTSQRRATTLHLLATRYLQRGAYTKTPGAAAAVILAHLLTVRGLRSWRWPSAHCCRCRACRSQARLLGRLSALPWLMRMEPDQSRWARLAQFRLVARILNGVQQARQSRGPKSAQQKIPREGNRASACRTDPRSDSGAPAVAWQLQLLNIVSEPAFDNKLICAAA